MGIFGIAFALILTGAAALFLIKFMYLPSIIFAVLSTYGYYSAIFFIFAYFNMRSLIKLIGLISKFGEDNISEISLAMKWKERSTLKFIRKYRKKGYIR
jgi:hypothetical protein